MSDGFFCCEGEDRLTPFVNYMSLDNQDFP